MPSPIPERNRQIYMVGAGLSVAMGLPNTAALVATVLDEYAKHPNWRHSGALKGVKDAFKFFYPDGGNKDFRPDAVDFFSMLKSYIETAEHQQPGGLKDAIDLFRSLKFA